MQEWARPYIHQNPPGEDMRRIVPSRILPTNLDSPRTLWLIEILLLHRPPMADFVRLYGLLPLHHSTNAVLQGTWDQHHHGPSVAAFLH